MCGGSLHEVSCHTQAVSGTWHDMADPSIVFCKMRVGRISLTPRCRVYHPNPWLHTGLRAQLLENDKSCRFRSRTSESDWFERLLVKASPPNYTVTPCLKAHGQNLSLDAARFPTTARPSRVFLGGVAELAGASYFMWVYAGFSLKVLREIYMYRVWNVFPTRPVGQVGRCCLAAAPVRHRRLWHWQQRSTAYGFTLYLPAWIPIAQHH